jgi:hypothetical protein
MTGAIVVCPGCRMTMQLPDTAGLGNVMCPSCGIVLAIHSPSTATAPPPPPSNPVKSRDTFAELPAFQAPHNPPPPPTTRPESLTRPEPVQRPATTLPPTGQPNHYPNHNYNYQPARRQRPSALKILGIGAGLLLFCGGMWVLFAFFVGLHSGWETFKFYGCTIKMPPGKQLTETKQTHSAGFTFHEVVNRRRESESQYIIRVSERLPGRLRSLKINRLVDNTITLANQRSVVRDSVSGLRGTIVRGVAGYTGCEAECFTHDERMVITIYAPYSTIKDRIGGERPPRSNENALDRPEEFFESLNFR